MTTAANVPAGTYTDTITLNWTYHICFTLGILGICNFTDGTATTTVAVTLTVNNDCAIDAAPNVAFGSAALPSAFATATGLNIQTRCTQGANYSVNLSSANSSTSDNWRQMAYTSTGTPATTSYLQYRILRNGTPWTDTYTYANTGNGVAQAIPYTAQINPTQANKPAGNYQDTVTITLSY